MYYVIGIGSNLGDKALNINNAIKLLAQVSEVVKVSSVYKSKALLKPNSPVSWNKGFLNLAVLLNYPHAPITLFKVLQTIEQLMGRKKHPRPWAPRIIDLDILIADNLIIQEETLQIPHKELLNRDFALIPAAEVAPDFIHPFAHKSLRELSLILKPAPKNPK
ncbi:2-amino-4-hydroxy-6-hydroxymethyldihydropteridine diphosphokinase [Candidatus Bandiella euplotis]|uniref:2-amino-4-hydroxy-6-hydroxymethyldihydropteridine pyrophosphokinase n=1 Tax=Candidatus Bandiella euplotis TaxID=1664265 RepID=A0ABZ0UMZ6_9RICK|nr:2-amino-4-hydroxy-6-hydroxymethyldihydropteridine diphosphokinase [Candidatus Bandiella woodruffii]WPX96631.1 2-amino-4-hydroxy-6-hydroxymethyldihydropteridine pyrophosphokinase [Candidatus Bandiella woodruffii]